ncbi:hypothetical protein [Streptomyces sp. NPDC007991]|uniref:hypothetical protein n=1 Tax=Streptomyces sp. NPDC007991 TaxID=3364803 RepID=UPI0036E57AE3
MLDGVVLVTGVMAAGKSTVAQALPETLPRAATRVQLRLRYSMSAAAWHCTPELLGSDSGSTPPS